MNTAFVFNRDTTDENALVLSYAADVVRQVQLRTPDTSPDMERLKRAYLHLCACASSLSMGEECKHLNHQNRDETASTLQDIINFFGDSHFYSHAFFAPAIAWLTADD